MAHQSWINHYCRLLCVDAVLSYHTAEVVRVFLNNREAEHTKRQINKAYITEKNTAVSNEAMKQFVIYVTLAKEWMGSRVGLKVIFSLTAWLQSVNMSNQGPHLDFPANSDPCVRTCWRRENDAADVRKWTEADYWYCYLCSCDTTVP